MNSYIEKVVEFHRTFNAPIEDNPIIPNEDRCNLRVKLIQEELNELEEALNKSDIIEAADACGDLMVVLCGTIIELGLTNTFDEIYQRIHDSNMSKSCVDLEEVDETLKYYNSLNIDCIVNKSNDRYIINRKEDNKILKSINYKKVELSDIIENKTK